MGVASLKPISSMDLRVSGLIGKSENSDGFAFTATAVFEFVFKIYCSGLT